jgi:hypothetical protein
MRYAGAATGPPGRLLEIFSSRPSGNEFFIENEFKRYSMEVRSLAVKAHEQGVAEFPAYKRPHSRTTDWQPTMDAIPRLARI